MKLGKLPHTVRPTIYVKFQLNMCSRNSDMEMLHVYLYQSIQYSDADDKGNSQQWERSIARTIDE
jgi:hypothetical protein